MKVLVTGGAGFIGSHVVEQSLARGWDVVVLDDFSSGRLQNLETVADHGNLRILEGSILDSTILSKAISGIDVVVHEAAIVSVVRSIEDPSTSCRVNVEGTVSLLHEARKAGVSRVVYASSCGVYGDAKKLPTKESDPVEPRSPYAVSKAAGEQYCRAFHWALGLDTVCLRYANVYGPRRSVGPYSGVMVKFADRILRDEPPLIFGDGQQTRDFVYSTDVAEATILAAEKPGASGKVINVGTGVSTSVYDLARTMARAAGKANLDVVKERPRPGEIRFSQPDTNLAKEILHFEYRVPLRDGVRKFIEWYRYYLNCRGLKLTGSS